MTGRRRRDLEAEIRAAADAEIVKIQGDLNAKLTAIVAQQADVKAQMATEEEKRVFWAKVGASLPPPMDYGVQPTTCPHCGAPRTCCGGAKR